MPCVNPLLRLALCLLPLAPLQAAEPDLPTTVLDTVVVSGKLPGPGLWKISKDDHVLWLLGTIAPLPRRMDWESSDVEATIAASQELLLPPSASMRAEGAAFGGLFLLPSLMKARNNPGKETLSEVLPEADYARWTRLKQRYLGRDRGVEKRRPILAAAALQEEALDDADLTLDNLAAKVARRAAKKHDLTITQPKLEIVITDPKATIKEFAATPLDDLDCFRRTLDRLESDIETMKLRANAWALGDVELLQSLPYTDNFRACADALFESRIAERQGFADLEERLTVEWLNAADAALAKNTSTFALLPMSVMLRENGMLARLRGKGYRVQQPGETQEAEAEEADAESVEPLPAVEVDGEPEAWP
jgi:uncharacterized protein YbaP (TraB family)